MPSLISTLSGFCAIDTFSELIETDSNFPVPPTVASALISIEDTVAVEATFIFASIAFSVITIFSAFPPKMSTFAFGESTTTEGKVPSKETFAFSGIATTIPSNPSPFKLLVCNLLSERTSVMLIFVFPDATTLTGTLSGTSTRSVPSCVSINKILFIPPPETMVSPFTITLLSVTSPVPTPSEIYKSPSTTAFLSSTSGDTIERFPCIVWLFKSCFPSVYTEPATEHNMLDASPKDIGFSGFNVPSK